jgi:adenylate kinase
MKLIIFGPPGSGKGTYASRLQSKLGIPAIATGDMLREMAQTETEPGERVKRYMSKGELVPDAIVTQILSDRLANDDCKQGFILDGYPRTIEQAEALEKIATIDAVIQLVVPEWITVERLSSRRICKNCGAVYNLRFLKPKTPGVCDKCGGDLYQRSDDTPKVIRERLEVYEKQTEPILHHYSDRVPFVVFECDKIDIPPEVAVEEILGKLTELNLT